MSDWKEVVEDGQVYYVNEEIGNIVKLGEGAYVSLYPKVIRFGPFETLEQAKQAFQNKAPVDQMIDQINQSLVALCRQVKGS